MPQKKMSFAQARVMEELERGPLHIYAKIYGNGWRPRLGIEMRTIDALEKMGAIKRKIVGSGVTRKMVITKSTERS
jgi:enhancing lycopene biosynthesis protein 2